LSADLYDWLDIYKSCKNPTFLIDSLNLKVNWLLGLVIRLGYKVFIGQVHEEHVAFVVNTHTHIQRIDIKLYITMV
jgi:hypothetical protein